MTCPACAGYATTGYRRGRPVPCRKCRGTGWIGELFATWPQAVVTQELVDDWTVYAPQPPNGEPL